MSQPRYTEQQLAFMRLCLVAHAVKMMADRHGDERVSRYAKSIMTADPEYVLDRINNVEPTEMIDF